MNIKSYLETVIAMGQYNVDDLIYKIDKFWIDGKLTEEEREDLIRALNENALDQNQVDLYAKVVELEDRIFALEHPATDDYPIWTAGYTTRKGEIVKYDYDNDGDYDLLKYDGGREQTALSPGKINGWYVVDENGDILGSYYNGEFTPVNE